MSDEEEYEECFLPACNIERIGNCILFQCHSEDDAIIAFELFREVTLGNPIMFRPAGS